MVNLFELLNFRVLNFFVEEKEFLCEKNLGRLSARLVCEASVYTLGTRVTLPRWSVFSLIPTLIRNGGMRTPICLCAVGIYRSVQSRTAVLGVCR